MSHIVCPYWLGYLLASPVRRLVQKPERILPPFVKSGMTILEIGPGMGFFSLPLAGMVGPGGKVVCVDVQKKMLQSLQRRALKAGLSDRIVTRLCESTSLGVGDFDGRMDFALAFAVVHEIPDTSGLFVQIARALKVEARCLVAEPRMHVSAEAFERTIGIAAQHGLRLVERPRIAGSHAALLMKGSGRDQPEKSP